MIEDKFVIDVADHPLRAQRLYFVILRYGSLTAPTRSAHSERSEEELKKCDFMINLT